MAGEDPGLAVVASASPDTDALARALGAETVHRPPPMPADTGWSWSWDAPLAAWRRALAATPPPEQVVVCTWPEDLAAAPLVQLTPEQWRAAVEWPSALWFTTLVTVAERCVDGGSIVAVVDRPATLDSFGHGASVAVGDGVTNLVRSLAATHGRRRVRVNAVTSTLHTAPTALMGAPPPLATFPGTPAGEVAGAVRMLLSPDAVGVTGTSVAADCGRR